MTRVASLYLPYLPIERSWRSHDGAPRDADPASVDRIGEAPTRAPLPAPYTGWRPGARWARDKRPEIMASSPLHQPSEERLFVTRHKVGNRIEIAAVSPASKKRGLRPGMALTQARTLFPDLEARDAEPARDAALLEQLALWAARRWTPRAAICGPDGLRLDLTGVTHLFGGEQAMGQRILAFCARLGFTAHLAVAGTPGAAHALARHGGKSLIICPSGGEAAALGPCPLAALRVEQEVLEAARTLGIDDIGALIAMPRAPLERRFGRTLLKRLDQALGRVAEPFEPIIPQEPPTASLGFAEPIGTAEAIASALDEAMRRLVADLAESGLGIRRLHLACLRVDNRQEEMSIGTAKATRDAMHLLRLLLPRIEQIDPGFGIDRLTLTAVRVEPLGAVPIPSILSGAETPDLVPLIDRLADRLGTRRLYRASAIESDVPERSVRRVGPLATPVRWPAWPRPVLMLGRPEPVQGVIALLPDQPPRLFVWRGRAHRVTRADGPERIHGEWWRHAAEAEAVRDYFQLEDQDGRRFWIFRKGDGVDPRTGDLSWWLQGMMG